MNKVMILGGGGVGQNCQKKEYLRPTQLGEKIERSLPWGSNLNDHSLREEKLNSNSYGKKIMNAEFLNVAGQTKC